MWIIIADFNFKLQNNCYIFAISKSYYVVIGFACLQLIDNCEIIFYEFAIKMNNNYYN